MTEIKQRETIRQLTETFKVVEQRIMTRRTESVRKMFLGPRERGFMTQITHIRNKFIGDKTFNKPEEPTEKLSANNLRRLQEARVSPTGRTFELEMDPEQQSLRRQFSEDLRAHTRALRDAAYALVDRTGWFDEACTDLMESMRNGNTLEFEGQKGNLAAEEMLKLKAFADQPTPEHFPWLREMPQLKAKGAIDLALVHGNPEETGVVATSTFSIPLYTLPTLDEGRSRPTQGRGQQGYGVAVKNHVAAHSDVAPADVETMLRGFASSIVETVGKKDFGEFDRLVQHAGYLWKAAMPLMVQYDDSGLAVEHCGPLGGMMSDLDPEWCNKLPEAKKTGVLLSTVNNPLFIGDKNLLALKREHDVVRLEKEYWEELNMPFAMALEHKKNFPEAGRESAERNVDCGPHARFSRI